MNKLAILTTAFNHKYNIYFKNNWNKFCQHINELNLSSDTYVCEILPKTTSESIAHIDNGNHYTVYNDSILWHKESAINYLLNKLPDKYSYVLLLDNDVVFESNDWYEKTQKLLESSAMVQPYDTLKYLENDALNIESINNSTCYNIAINYSVLKGNHGIAVAYRREYLKHMNGLFDEGIAGGGDLLNIVPFIYDLEKLSFKIIFEILCKDSAYSFIDYIKKANSFLQKYKTKTSYIKNCCAHHMFHGYLKDRQYYNRYNIINQYNLNTIVEKNQIGFYNIIDNEIGQKFKNFFDKRQSIQYLNKPTIIVDSSYGADYENALWLAPCDRIRCRNIKKISIELENVHSVLKNISIVINNNHTIDTKDLLDQKTITLNIENPTSIQLSATDPPKLENDIRELGLLIRRIKILDENTNDMITYPLSDVL